MTEKFDMELFQRRSEVEIACNKIDFQSKNDHGPVLLVPVQQASLPSLENTLFDCEHVEEVGREQ